MMTDLGPVWGVRRRRVWTVCAAGRVGHGKTFELALRDALGSMASN